MQAVAEQYRFAGTRFAGLAIPVLLLLGGDSPRLFSAATAKLESALPNCRVVELPSQQHVAMNTAPEMFLNAIMEFLESPVAD